MGARWLVLLVVALVAAVLVILFLTDRRHQEVRRLPFLVADLALVRGGEITFLGIAAGVSLLILVGLAALFLLPQRLVPTTEIFRTTTGSA